MILGFEGIPVTSPNRYMFMVMNDILGGGMSSRMFQEIREEKGLAYTVSSFTDTYMDCGLQLIYSVVKPDKVNECLDAMKKEILRLKSDGITNDELARAKDSIKSSVLLGLESNVSKMRFNINNELFLGRDLSSIEIIHNINCITVDDIYELLQNYLDWDKMSLFLYGDVAPQ
jgi:predicted Zn-dependent peptidase